MHLPFHNEQLEKAVVQEDLERFVRIVGRLMYYDFLNEW